MGAYGFPTSTASKNYVALPDSSPAIFVHSQENGVNKVINDDKSDPYGGTPIKSDPYGGTPINITVGNSASALDSISGVLGSGFQGLFDLIQHNTDKNNAWSAAQAQNQMNFQERMNQNAMEFNSLEAGKNRDWQEYMSNTAHQREVADLKAAGLNPVLSASGGNGAAVGSGATASGVTSSGAMGDTDESGSMALSSIYGALLNAQTQMYNANLSAKTNLQMAELQREGSMYGSELMANASIVGSSMSANAQKYGYDQSLLNNREQRDWNAKHPGSAQQKIIWNDETSSKHNKASAKDIGNSLYRGINPLAGIVGPYSLFS